MTATAVGPQTDLASAPGRLPRLLPSAGAPLRNLAAHLAKHGPMPELRHERHHVHPLIARLEGAGLTGRGGAGFPTARKFAAVAAGRGQRTVVVNAVEAEPMVQKDVTLCLHAPHLVLDGALAAAEAVDARRVIFVANPSAVAALTTAVDERRSAGLDKLTPEIVAAADHYVAGEERAVVNWIERGVSLPTARGNRPFERGVAGRPTLVNNVETLAHVALIARYGEEWFRSVGTRSEPGTVLLTARGALHSPGVYEAAVGTPIGDIVSAAGGATGVPAAFLVGGYFGTWIGADVARVPFSREGLAPLGASVGAGLIVAMPTACCGVIETARLASYLAGQSAGQCGPCVFGLRAISDELDRLARKVPSEDGLVKLRRWLGEVEGRGACAHPDGVVRLIRSALTVFADEVERHELGLCAASSPEMSVLDLARGPHR